MVGQVARSRTGASYNHSPSVSPLLRALTVLDSGPVRVARRKPWQFVCRRVYLSVWGADRERDLEGPGTTPGRSLGPPGPLGAGVRCRAASSQFAVDYPRHDEG